MDLRIFLLVLFAALIHASWNYLSKKVSGNIQVMLLGLWLINILLLPACIYILVKDGLTFEGFKYISISAAAHLFYYYFLNLGYRAGDISIVYPVSRGTGIAGTALASYFLLGEIFSIPGKTGIILICLGVIVIGFSRVTTRANIKILFYSFIIGITIVIYSVNDKTGVSHVNPVFYITVKDIMALSVMSPFFFKGGFGEIKELIRNNLKTSLMIGIGARASYLIVLFAFTVEKAGYISAVREFSIVFGSIMGILLLKEKLTFKKASGIMLITLGLVFIRIA